MSILSAVQLAIGFVFLVAVATKLRSPAQFKTAVALYQAVPRRLEWAAVAAVICAELVIVFTHVLNIPGIIGTVVALGTTVVLFLVVTLALYHGKSVECGCFGGLFRRETSAIVLVRLGLLISGELSVLSARLLRPMSWPEGLDIFSFVVIGYMCLLLQLGIWIGNADILTGLFKNVFGVVRRHTTA